jgi:uncharacterized membrane protein (UPF0127 family)
VDSALSFLQHSRRAFMAMAAALLLFAPACAQDKAQPRLPVEPMIIHTAYGPVPLTVEIADDETERAAGLMHRPAPAKGEGMLFDFNQPRDGVAFWMRNTPAPLDILFISPDGRIIRIAKMTRPFSDAPIPAGGLIRGVLEIAGGRADELRIREGDRVEHKIFP